MPATGYPDRQASQTPAGESDPSSQTQEIVGTRMLEAEAFARPRQAEVERPRTHIDITQLQQKGVVPLNDSREIAESEYRRIKRPLLANVTGRGAVKVDRGEAIMVTSAQQGEGKTFTSFNLAYSFAQERDWEIILIDGDNTRRTLTRSLGLDVNMGLMDVLSGACDNVDDVIVTTDIERLSFIPAGQRNAQASEFLSSKRMEAVIGQLLSVKHRIVLFDAPPLLGTSDALVLSESVGQIIVVVKAGSTQRDAVAAAIQPLDKNKAINLLLNQVVRAHGDSYGGYHYGYGYGDGAPRDGGRASTRS